MQYGFPTRIVLGSHGYCFPTRIVLNTQKILPPPDATTSPWSPLSLWATTCNRCSQRSRTRSAVKVGILNERGTLSPYVDEFGEEDRNLTRRRPLQLDPARMARLARLWHSHAIPGEVVRERQVLARVIRDGYY